MIYSRPRSQSVAERARFEQEWKSDGNVVKYCMEVAKVINGSGLC
jgi:hypothetical protein